MSRLGMQEAYGSLNKNIRGYTLVELAITLGVILILSTIGLYSYFGALAHARKTVCQTNLKALKTAVEEYVWENDALPGTLGRLKLEHVEKGYAKAMEDMGRLTKLSLLLLKFDESGNAYAQFLTHENLNEYGAIAKTFRCPIDGNGPPSYGINGNLAGRNWSEVGQNEIIVADCEKYVFTSLDQLAKRHFDQALAITKSGKIVKVPDTDDDYVVDNDDNDEEENVEEENVEEDDDMVTICHKGKTSKTKSGSALDAHLAHGDTLGPCPED